MVSIQDINSTIIQGSFTNEQLESIIMAVKFARGQLAQKNTGALVKGTQVKFTNNRNGQLMLGAVVEVKRKFIHVKVGMTTYRVPANMLEAA